MQSSPLVPTPEFTPDRAARFEELQRKLVPLWRLIGRTDPGGDEMCIRDSDSTERPVARFWKSRTRCQSSPGLIRCVRRPMVGRRQETPI